MIKRTIFAKNFRKIKIEVCQKVMILNRMQTLRDLKVR